MKDGSYRGLQEIEHPLHAHCLQYSREGGRCRCEISGQSADNMPRAIITTHLPQAQSDRRQHEA
jgi:hypothetical protein